MINHWSKAKRLFKKIYIDIQIETFKEEYAQNVCLKINNESLL